MKNSKIGWTAPRRLQLSRKRGFRLQEASRALNGLAVVKVARMSIWGNPWPVGVVTLAGETLTADKVVERYEGWAEMMISDGVFDLEMLRGKNLACWCALGAPCHADVLLRLANAPGPCPGHRVHSGGKR